MFWPCFVFLLIITLDITLTDQLLNICDIVITVVTVQVFRYGDFLGRLSVDVIGRKRGKGGRRVPLVSMLCDRLKQAVSEIWISVQYCQNKILTSLSTFCLRLRPDPPGAPHSGWTPVSRPGQEDADIHIIGQKNSSCPQPSRVTWWLFHVTFIPLVFHYCFQGTCTPVVLH